MIIVPAVDIKGGKCVRLLRGRAEDETVYFEDPLDAARRWKQDGAELIHVVDLDGAFTGRMVNTEHIGRIVRECRNVRIEAGGGIRSATDIEALLEYGVSRVVVGTKAVESPTDLAEFCSSFPGKVAVGIDAQKSKVAIKGWTSTTDVSLMDFVKMVCDTDPCAIIYTDISRDGAMTGPNFDRTAEVCEASSVPVVASGGVSSLDDIRKLNELPLEGAIVGKALFEEVFSLPEAIEAIK